MIYNYKTIILDNYIVIVVNSPEKKTIFKKYIKYYYDKYNHSKNYIGLDFEFNNRINKLSQIIYYEKIMNKYDGVVFLIDYYDFTKKEQKFIIRKIYISDIYKILHGSESLDIPYIYSILVSTKNIIKFTKKLIDTVFLCYYKNINVKENTKCSLYYALLYNNIISEDTFNYLDKINKNMGKVYKIDFTIAKLNDNKIKYSVYDVIYLKKLYEKLCNIKEYKLIIQLTQFVLLVKQNIIILDTNNKQNENIDYGKIMMVQYFKSTLSKLSKNNIILFEKYNFNILHNYFSQFIV